MSAPLQFPQFDPVLLHLGPLQIRWYALAYIVGLVTGWQVMRRLVRLTPAVASLTQTDDFLTWATLGVVLGGRLGYCLFYQPGFFLTHPLQIAAVWTGGMSFHGGMIGVITAIVLFCRRNGIPVLGFADRMAIVTPIGLGPTSSMASCGGGRRRTGCRGAWCFRARRTRCRATPASCIRR